MNDNISAVLKRLDIKDTGTYKNHFYVINLEDSNDYARMYTKLDKNAINTEYPDIQVNSNKSTTKLTNYFELEENGISYLLFLIADFSTGKYYLKIGESK